MSLNISYNSDVLYNSIKFENSDTGSYYKYITTQSLYLNKDVIYEITYRMYTEATSSEPFDLYITSSNNTLPFVRTNQFGYLIDEVEAKLNSFTTKQHLITPLYSGTASLALILKYGTYYIADIKVKPYNINNFSLGEMDLTIPTPPTKRNEPISITPIYISRNGKPIGDTSVVLVDAGESNDFSRYTQVTGSNLVISENDNLIEGSLFVGKNLRTGVEISGFDNAMIRSVGYAGYGNATNYNWPGFMIYSGSVLPGSGDNYRGVGLELHGGGNSGSLRYRVDDSGSFLEITGSIYATSGYFSGILSASIGKFGGWTIDSSSFYSKTITMWSTQSQSSGSAIEFYDRKSGKTYLAIAVQDRNITSYIISQSYDAFEDYYTDNFIPVTKSVKTAYFTLGESLEETTGSSMIFDFASAGNLLNGDLIITGAKNVIYDLSESGSFTINKPIIIDGIYGKATYDSTWIQRNSPINPANNNSVIYNNKFYISNGTNIPNGYYTQNWANQSLITASTAGIYSINENSYGRASSSTYIASTQRITSRINDTIHAGIWGENSSRQWYGIKVGVYGRATAMPVINLLYEVTHSNRGIAVLGDAVPASTAWSGLFRFGKFGVGDPFNNYISGSVSSSIPEMVLYVDAAKKLGIYGNNPSFGRVGINTYKPEYALHVSGSSGSLGIIYASDDIISFSDVRKKTNIIQITGSIEKILNLTGVTFNKTNGTEDKITNTRPVVEGERTKIGLIAQEVEKILPEVVYTDDEGYKSIGYANIVALLIEGVKEQQSQIEELKKEINKLKNAQ